MTDLGTLGGHYSIAYAINDAGDVVGYSTTGSNDAHGQPISHAFLYKNGTMTDLGTLGGNNSVAHGINEAGQAVGYSLTPSSYSAFLYTGGMTDLGTLGGQGSQAYGINAAGEIVGYSASSSDVLPHSFVKNNGAMTDLMSFVPPDSGWTYLLQANATNNAGQIVGVGQRNGHNRAFLLTLSDVKTVSINWHATPATVASSFTPDQGGGVDLAYKVDGHPLPSPVPIALYWASGPNFSDILSAKDDPAYQIDSKIDVGSYSLHVQADDLGIPPDGSTDLLLVVNPLASPDEDQVAALPASPLAIMSPVGTSTGQVVQSLAVQTAGPVISAAFRPAGGALTLEQADAILDVDHLNWIQTMTSVPPAWTVSQQSVVYFSPVLEPGNSILYDPAIGSAPVQVQTSTGAPIINVRSDGVPDQYVFYFNEPPSDTADNDGLAKATSEFQLFFSDEPSFNSGIPGVAAFDAGESVSFLTKLVGVDIEDLNSPETWGGVNPGFAWQTDADTGAGAGAIVGFDYTATSPDDSALPTVVSGGVSRVQFVPILSVTANGGAANGRPFAATVSITGRSGVASPSLDGVMPTLTYYAGATADGSPISGAPTVPGTYTVVAAFHGDDDYASTSKSVTFSIDPIKAVWLYTDQITSPPAWQDLVNQSIASGINTIYLNVYQSVPNDSGRLMYGDGNLAALITSAHAHRIQVWADYGAPDWPSLGTDPSSFPMQRLGEVLAYNTANPTAPFDGVMLDVEFASTLR